MLKTLPLHNCFSLLFALTTACSIAHAAEPQYPLWNNHETVADYAKKVNLLPMKTLELGDNVKMELVLIPAGKFMMGTPPPTPVDEAGFSSKIARGQLGLAASGSALLIVLGFVLAQAIRKRLRPQVSLGLLLLVTVATGGCVLSGLHWRQSANGLQVARLEFTLAELRFSNANDYEKPAHMVTLTQPFYLGKYDVTQEQYQAVIGTNPSRFKGKDNPVEMVSWDEAQVFCKKLTERTTQTLRLPTEAEWEYGCRAGTTSTYHSGDADADLGRVAWYDGNSNTTQPVGQKEPNTFGLYDMHGNVWQWCQDLRDENYYSKSPTENPQGPDHGVARLLRGGSWYDFPMYCRSAIRYRLDPDDRGNTIGFRVVVPAFRTSP